MVEKFKNYLIELLFPKFCFGCQKEGDFLCEDCKAILDILKTHQKFRDKNLSDLYFAIEYKNPLIKNLIQKFKYEPFAKELAKPLTSLIINHFQLLEKQLDFSEFVLVPIPLEKRKLKWRGFNQAEEIGKEVSKFLKIQVLNDVLIKVRETSPQAELSEEERKRNVKGAFLIKELGGVRSKKILLVDDVYTTGSTMEECAKILKEARAKEIIGLVIARAAPNEDRFQSV